MLGPHSARLRQALPITIAAIFCISITVISGQGYKDVSATQCSRHLPESYYYENHDVVFLGKVTDIARYEPLDQGWYITFDVSRSWKGFDTSTITVHSIPKRFEMEGEYLVYASKNFLAIDSDYCTTQRISISDTEDPSVKFLNDNYPTIPLREGSTVSLNYIPIVAVLGAAALGIIGYIKLRGRNLWQWPYSLLTAAAIYGIILSGFVIGWMLDIISRRLDGPDTTCLGITDWECGLSHASFYLPIAGILAASGLCIIGGLGILSKKGRRARWSTLIGLSILAAIFLGATPAYLLLGNVECAQETFYDMPITAWFGMAAEAIAIVMIILLALGWKKMNAARTISISSF